MTVDTVVDMMAPPTQVTITYVNILGWILTSANTYQSAQKSLASHWGNWKTIDEKYLKVKYKRTFCFPLASFIFFPKVYSFE